MAWYSQATSHLLSQHWPRIMLPYGVARPQWVKIVIFTLISLGILMKLLQENATEPVWIFMRSLNIDSSNGLWWCQATSHYLGQCWPTSMLPCGVRTQKAWVNMGLEWSLQGAVSIRKTVLPGMAIPMLKIRRPNGRLIFNMEITIRR